MIIVMKRGAEPAAIESVVRRVEELGHRVHLSRGEARTIIGLIGADEYKLDYRSFEILDGVDKIMRVMSPYQLASRDFSTEDTVVELSAAASTSKSTTPKEAKSKSDKKSTKKPSKKLAKNPATVQIGSDKLVICAGPSTIESREQILETAHAVKSAGATLLRGSPFTPRRSPYAFEGLGEDALKYLAEAREQTGLAIVAEIMSVAELELISTYADILQVGTRNNQNYPLLKAVGNQSKPVLLKRGINSTIEELLLAAEHVLVGGNKNVILCERGISTYETATRHTFDVNAIPLLHELTHLPVMADPSRGTGRAALVSPIAKAAVAAGTDALMLDVHPDPERALINGSQSLSFEQFEQLMAELTLIARAVGREI